MSEPNYKAEPSYDIRDALKLPILFYTIYWTDEKKAEWLRITGSSEASTKVMCDHIRSALSFMESAGHVTGFCAMSADVEDPRTLRLHFRHDVTDGDRRALVDAMNCQHASGLEAAEIGRLRAWVADLQSGLYVNCVYCGHRYGPGETTPVSMADALKAHVAVCPEHPMAGLLTAAKGIESAERHYRVTYETLGGGHIETGRAWDKLRKRGDDVRAAIAAVEPKQTAAGG